jgi:hypothetical protein
MPPTLDYRNTLTTSKRRALASKGKCHVSRPCLASMSRVHLSRRASQASGVIGWTKEDWPFRDTLEAVPFA